MILSPLISVIIPVWNVSRYVERSFRSLLDQTYGNIEYIIVDDASPDNSMGIISSLLESYPCKKVKIIAHQKNRGLAAARATGLSHASGEYILQLDSDDCFEKDYVESMASAACETQSDIVICDYQAVYPHGERYFSQEFRGDGKQLCESILVGKTQGFVWNKLIRRKLYTDHGIFPIEGINMWEDVAVMGILAYFADKVYHIPHAFIHYNQTNTNSYSTHRLSEKSLRNIISAVAVVSDFHTSHATTISQDVLNVFKLRAKFFCLVNSRGKFRREINELYPETKNICFKKRLIPAYSHIIHIAAYFRIYFVIDLLMYMLNLFKRIITEK